MANGILTQKQKEAEEACTKMNTSFVNLNTQINTTNTDGYKPLENKTSSLKSLTEDMLQASIDMNNVPTE